MFKSLEIELAYLSTSFIPQQTHTVSTVTLGTDLEKAFETLDHDILRKLEMNGLTTLQSFGLTIIQTTDSNMLKLMALSLVVE